MKVSLNIIQQFIDFELPPVDELVKRINEQLGGVEEVVDLGAKYKDAKIVRVVECEKHPNADRLSVCKIDAGTGELVQVVCGAPNVHAGMWAVWLPPESIVPSTFDTDEPFKLGARELRGVMSNGMLAAADELAIGTDHEGILEINPDEWKPGAGELTPGVSFAKVYGLDDYVIDIENKMFTHRPDLFGQLGVAREIAGIFGHAFTSPRWYMNEPVFEAANGLELEVFNEAGQKVPRFMAVAMKNIEVKPSPLWLQCALVAMGSKPINNIVDVTNYIMLLTAQPTHAYDYDKLRGHKLGARMAKKGETAELLNGKTYELDENDIVIVDGEGVVGLGGIMGGGNSEVSAETKHVVLEVANFDMYAVRRSSMRHGLFTDALTRFNKGQSPLQNPVVLSHLMNMIGRLAGGQQASDVFDPTTVADAKPRVETAPDFVNERLGLKLDEGEMATLLRNVEFEVTGGLSVIPPFWRTDIALPEDVVEEIGRLYGYHELPQELPARSTRPAPKNELRELKRLLRESLSRAGANEVLTYSFVHENVIRNAEQDPTQAFRVSNALSPDLQYYRLSVLPSLLDKVHGNIKAGHDEFTLFEIGKGHHKANVDQDGLPNESQLLEGVYTSKVSREGAAYYHMRRFVTQLAADLGLDIRFTAITQPLEYAGAMPYDQTRSALIEDHQGSVLGMVGELRQSVSRKFKLPPYSAAMTLQLDVVGDVYQAAGRKYRPLSRYPSISQDISLQIMADASYAEVLWSAYEGARSAVNETVDVRISPISIYQPPDSERKTITFHVVLTNHERTMTEDEAAGALDAITNATGAARV